MKKKLTQDEEYFFYKSPPLWPKILLTAIITSFGFGVLYACFSKIDEVVVSRGELQALGAQKPIKSPLSGVIDQVLIKEGESVSKNTLLITFNTKSLKAKKEGFIAKLNEKKFTYVKQNIEMYLLNIIHL